MYMKKPASLPGLDLQVNAAIPFAVFALTSSLLVLGSITSARADGFQACGVPNQPDGSTDNINFNTWLGTGTLTPGYTKKLIWQDSGSSSLDSLDGQITGQLYGTFDWATGIWVFDPGSFGTNTATINIPNNTTVAGEFDGTGLGFASGIEANMQYGYAGSPALVVNNSGTVSGAVNWNDGVAAGLDSNVDFGDQNITNNGNSNFTANAYWYTTAIHARSNYGDLYADQNGSATATSSGGARSPWTGAGWSVGLDLQTVVGNITVNNSGVTSGTVDSAGGEASGAYLWANTDPSNPYYRPNTGNLTLNNWGTFTAACPNGATAKGVYCGGNGQYVNVNNYGTINATGSPRSGFALGVEADGQVPINVFNNGTISGSTAAGVFVTSTTNSDPNSGGQGPAIIRNWGTISGSSGIACGAYPGPITVYNHGTISGTNGAMNFWSGGLENVYMYGTPSVSGTMYASNPNSTLHLHITAPISSISGGNGQTSSNLSNDGLGSNGSITAGGNTYSWSNMNVSGFTAAIHIKTGVYEIQNRQSGLAFDEPGGQTSPGTRVWQYGFWGGQNQLWTITNLGNGRYTIVNNQSGLALDDWAWGTNNGNPIDVYTPNNQENQQWTFTQTDSNYFTISSAYTPYSCIDVPGASSNDSVYLQMYTLDDADQGPNGGWGQQWAFVPR